MLWGKLLVNAGINPLTALLRVKNGVLASRESYREMVAKTVNEGESVAKARGKAFIHSNHIRRRIEWMNR